MALTKELLNLLDNKGEPLAKRLKIANNAFISTELPIRNKEAILFKWILKNSNDTPMWEIFRSWVDSGQFREINRTEITNEDITSIINGLTKKLQHVNEVNEETKTIIFNCLSCLLNHRIFLQYFKYNTESYCTFITNILHKIDNLSDLFHFLKGEHLFHKNVIGDEAFIKQFLEINLPELVLILKKFGRNDKQVFQEVSKIIQKCVFNKNGKKFDDFFNKMFKKVEGNFETSFPKTILKAVLSSYNLELKEAVLTYQLIFHAFCTTYNYKTELLYEFLIILLESIGFQVADTFNLNNNKIINKYKNLNASLEKSLEILSGLEEILTEHSNINSLIINKVTFTNLMQNIIKTVIFLTKKPNEFCYDIIINSIKINPLIIEPIVSDVVIYSLLNENHDYKEKREKLLICVFEVFSKLHRIQNLISKILPALKDVLESKETCQPGYQFLGVIDIEISTTINTFGQERVFPEVVLNYFTNCICNLASWQVMNLFMTLTFHLHAAVDNLSTIKDDEGNFIYVEILESLMTGLLSSVRVAEHTVTSSVVDKFVKNLEQLKIILAKFGCAVLHREHNHILMKAFLNISYAWGEMYIILSYYSHSDEVVIPLLLDNDYSACNVTYIHSYLSVQKWCLIYERIKNFGGRPCKILIQKLFLQKLRAMSLFHKPSNKKEMLSVITPIISIISLNLEENWKFILSEKFINNHLIKHMDTQSIISLTEFLIDDKDFKPFDNLDILENTTIIKGCIFALLSKINKLFKKKRKHGGDSNLFKPLSSKIYSKITTEEMFFNNEDDCTNLKEIFDGELMSKSDEVTDLKLNEEEIVNYLKTLIKLPIIFNSEKVQKIVLIYLFALHKDTTLNNTVNKFIESVLISLTELTKIQLFEVFNIEILMQYITKNFTRSVDIFTTLIENIFKKEKSVINFKTCVTCVSDNIKNPEFLAFGLIILNSCNKLKKQKISIPVKEITNEYKQLICKKTVKLLTKKNVDETLIEAYAVMLKIFLSKDEVDENLAKLSPLLESYIEFALTETNVNYKGLLLLFTTVLQNKSKLNDIKEDAILKIWNVCKTLDVNANNLDEYSQLIALIFEHVPNEDFSNITLDLLNYTVHSIDSKNYVQFQKFLTIWTSILSCRFNPVKTKTWQNILEALLLKFLTLFKEISYNEELFNNIINFIIALIQMFQLPITPLIIDVLLLIVTELIFNNSKENFVRLFNSSILVLECLLKYRNALIMDRLPPFLQEYRILLKELSINSNSDLKLDLSDVQKMADCSHQMEKFTKNLVGCNKHMVRMAPYLIADILKEYEQVTLYPNVKIHLNNCIYSLISLCDQHAVSYLMRVLSSASTEIFKIMFDHYKKYYKFTGKI